VPTLMLCARPRKPAEQLGVTHMHEHLIADCSFSGNDPRKKLDDVEVAIAEMEYFKQAGGQTIVELTCRGLGQNAAALRRIAEESGVNIIAATGFYREVVYPDYVKSETVDQLAQRMIDDANQGIAGTDHPGHRRHGRSGGHHRGIGHGSRHR